MRVLHINTERGWRGGEAQALYLCQGLRTKGIESIIAAPRRSKFLERIANLGFSVVALPDGRAFNLRAILKLKWSLKREKPDLIHCHTASAHTLALMATIFSPSLPVVVSRRVDFPVAEGPLSRWKYFNSRIHYIAISAGVKKVLCKAGIKSERIDIVHSGINGDKFSAPKKSRTVLLAELNISPEAIIIGNVAALAEHKGHRYLIEAAKIVIKSLPEAVFLVAGEGAERRNLETQISRLGLAGRVQLLGFREDVVDIMRLFRLFVLSSHLEGLCTALLDAMALGIPVIATNTGGVPEVVKERETGLLVEAKNPGALAEAILYAVNHPEEMQIMANRAREFVLQHFTIDRMVAETINVYQKILRR